MGPGRVAADRRGAPRAGVAGRTRSGAGRETGLSSGVADASGAQGKFPPYRKAVQVPFLLRWPGRVPAGAVDDRLVTHVDVVPTILAATGVSQAHATLRATRQCAGAGCA